MGKRSEFPRIPRDKYMTTDPMPVARLQAHLPRGVKFAEPCAGNGDLIESMHWHGHECIYACDLHPGRAWVDKRSAFRLDKGWLRLTRAQMFVTNPPWTRATLHPMIEHLAGLLPTWLLLDASWAHTAQAAPYLKMCEKVVSVGRVKWFSGSDHMSLDDSAWYLFSSNKTGRTEFHGFA